jgi:hypothetical protein
MFVPTLEEEESREHANEKKSHWFSMFWRGNPVR